MSWRDIIEEALSAETDECILWPMATRNGYGTFQRGRGKNVYAHREVCTLAHGVPASPDMQAAHRCGNHACINRRHLRWATRAENEHDKKAHGRSNDGERQGSSVLTEDDIRGIRALWSRGRHTQQEIADLFNTHQGQVSMIVNRKAWKCVS